MPTLYDLVAEYSFLQDLDDHDYEKALADLSADLKDKLIAISIVLKNLEADRDVFRVEGKRLLQLAEFRDNRIDHLKEYALAAMDQLHIDRVESGVHMIRKQASPESVELSAEFSDGHYQVATFREMIASDVPEELRQYVESVRPNRALLKKRLQEGAEVTGAKLYKGYHIRVK